MERPLFLNVWQRFSEINVSVDKVGDIIGGSVGVNIRLGVNDPVAGFTNACAIRMSYALNYSNNRIKRGVWKTVSGADRNWYIYRVKDLIAYLIEEYGPPEIVIQYPTGADFQGVKGILIFSVNGWRDASGHVTLWNGSLCSDRCYFPVSSEASLWLLD